MTRYKPNDPRDFLAAMEFLNFAKEQNIEVVLDAYSTPRTGQQNKYLYFCLAFFAHRYHCTEAEAKEVYLKRFACPQISEKHFVDTLGQLATWYRSTADIDYEQCGISKEITKEKFHYYKIITEK